VGLTNRVKGDFDQLGLSLTVLDDDGALRELPVGPFDLGHSTSTRRLPACRVGCRVEAISFGGPSALVEAMHGTVDIDRFQVDGHDVPGVLDRSWHVAQAQTGSPTAVQGRPSVAGGHLAVTFSARSSATYAGISPDDLPAVVPVLLGRQAKPYRTLTTGSSGTFPVQSVGRAESTPFRGPSGVVMDFDAFIRSALQTNSDTQVFVWARADTPQSILDELSRRGLSRPTTEASAKSVLDQDAFALALRLYSVVAVLVVLLALAGLAANLAVQLPARRRDAASLRVVGVTRRSVMAGVVIEFLVVIGAAALAGVAAGALAQYVVVKTVTLGFADTALTPRVLPSFHLSSGIRLSVVVMVVLFVVATGFALLTVRGARTSTLRENAR
jgi:putative ABC transport system permease protein